MSDYFLGEIRAFAFGLVPQDWLPCEGQILQIQQYTALYSLLGKYFGGDGVKTFALPDLRGRVIVGLGIYADPNGQAYQYNYGNAGGAETVALTSAQTPPHNHYLMGSTAAGNAGNSKANYISSWGASPQVSQSQNLYAAPGTMVPLNPGSLEATGGGQGHNNVQPFLVINYCIAAQGLYPARN
ncbi:MAG: tail fiber protein [Methylobacter sp.]|nr:tail fiber protein [Methylobacter sp.]